MSASNLPAIIPALAGNLSITTAPAEGVESTSVLLWNRPDPSVWGQYKADMQETLNMNTLTSRADATRMMDGNGPTMSGGLDIGRARSVQLRHSAQVCGSRWVASAQYYLTPKYTIPVCRRARELIPSLRKGKLTTENKPHKKHHQMYRQFSKPLGQLPANFRENIPELPRWREMTGGIKDWRHRWVIVYLLAMIPRYQELQVSKSD